jgi:hypothetical protein
MKLDTKTFVERAKQVHGDRYDYSRTEYKRSTEKVEIVCPMHGAFLQRPENHVNQKQHCPKCANVCKGKHERFSVEWMMRYPERAYAPALLYVAEVKNKGTNHLEVGVATKSIKKGYTTEPNTTLLHLQYMSLKQALLLEGEIQKALNKHLETSVIFSGGKTKRLKDIPAVRTILNQILLQNEKTS